MQKFIILYYSTPEAMAAYAQLSPEQQAEGMKGWFAWKESCGDHVTDFGSPLGGGQLMAADGSFEGATSEVSGFSLLEAEDIAHAQRMLASHPHSKPEQGMRVELHPYIAM